MKGHPWLLGTESDAETGSGLEMLQTDVMRFLAILALCLMVIFALVQSIPEAAEQASPQLRSRALLASELETLQKQLGVLLVEKKQLGMDVATLRRGLAASDRIAAAKRERLVALGGEVEAVGQLLKKEQDKLTALRSDTQSAQGSLTKLRSELKALRAEIGRGETRLEELNRTLGRSTTAESSDPVAGEETTEAAETGLELRFESDRVLQELVTAGTVGFFARAAERYWTLTADETGLVFTPSKPPTKLYEMTPSTVPINFVEALHSRVATFDRDAIVWGVTLPLSARHAITATSNSHRSGVLVIGPDADIKHRGQ